jgi:hypothetical protein
MMDHPSQAQGSQSTQSPFEYPRSTAQASSPMNNSLPVPAHFLQHPHSEAPNVDKPHPQQAFGAPGQHPSTWGAASHSKPVPSQYPQQASGIVPQSCSQQPLQPLRMLPNELHQRITKIELENAAFMTQLPPNERHNELMRQNKSLLATLTFQQVENAITQLGYSSVSQVGDIHSEWLWGKSINNRGFHSQHRLLDSHYHARSNSQLIISFIQSSHRSRRRIAFAAANKPDTDFATVARLTPMDLCPDAQFAILWRTTLMTAQQRTQEQRTD